MYMSCIYLRLQVLDIFALYNGRCSAKVCGRCGAKQSHTLQKTARSRIADDMDDHAEV